MPAGDLAAFLENPANTGVIVSLLMDDGVNSRISSLLGDRYLQFRNVEEGILLVLTDRRPGGSPPTLREFEERLIMYQTRGFHEVGRDGDEQTGELECSRCMAISRPGSTRCNSCRSTQLERATIPSTLTLALGIEPADRTNEELLETIWKNSIFLSTGNPE